MKMDFLFGNGDFSNVFLLNMVIFHCFPIIIQLSRIVLFENGGFFPMSCIRFLGECKGFFGVFWSHGDDFCSSPKTLGLLNTPSLINGLFWLTNEEVILTAYWDDPPSTRAGTLGNAILVA